VARALRCMAVQGEGAVVGDSVPCQRVRRARLGEAQAHGNVGRGLGDLGGSIVSGRRVRGVSHGRPRSDLTRGIDLGVLG
jgi:hypothetical protein